MGSCKYEAPSSTGRNIIEGTPRVRSEDRTEIPILILDAGFCSLVQSLLFRCNVEGSRAWGYVI